MSSSLYELCLNQMPHQKKDGCTLSLLSIEGSGGGWGSGCWAWGKPGLQAQAGLSSCWAKRLGIEGPSGTCLTKIHPVVTPTSPHINFSSHCLSLLFENKARTLSPQGHCEHLFSLGGWVGLEGFLPFSPSPMLAQQSSLHSLSVTQESAGSLNLRQWNKGGFIFVSEC